MTREQGGQESAPAAKWIIGWSAAVAVALVGAAAVLSWSLTALAGALQLLGIVMTGLGVAVVWAWFDRVAEKAIEAKRGLVGLWALGQRRRRAWWARRRGGPAPATPIGGSFTLAWAIKGLERDRPDRTAVSEREWLAALDDQMDDVYRSLNAAVQRLAAQRGELQDEILTATRQGWQLIFAGLVWSAVGVGLGMGA